MRPQGAERVESAFLTELGDVTAGFRRRPTTMVPYLRCFGYPFSKANLPLMVVGCAFFVGIPTVVSLVPMSVVLVLIVQLFLVAYYAVFLHSILGASMAGRAEFPAWPEEASLQELGEEIFALAGPYVVSFLPLIALRCAYANLGDLGARAWGITSLILSGPLGYTLPQVPVWFEPLSWALSGLGLLYLPMALLVWSFYGGSSILNPVAVARSARRTGASYLAVVAGIAATFFGLWGFGRLTSRLPYGWLQSLADALALFYALAVMMRLVGTHYFLNREKLDWEREIKESLPPPVPL